MRISHFERKKTELPHASGQKKKKETKNTKMHSIEEGQISLSLKVAISRFCRTSIRTTNKQTNGWRWRLLVIGAFDHHINHLHFRYIRFYAYFICENIMRYALALACIHLFTWNRERRHFIFNSLVTKYDLSESFWVDVCQHLNVLMLIWTLIFSTDKYNNGMCSIYTTPDIVMCTVTIINLLNIWVMHTTHSQMSVIIVYIHSKLRHSTALSLSEFECEYD